MSIWRYTRLTLNALLAAALAWQITDDWRWAFVVWCSLEMVLVSADSICTAIKERKP